MSVFRAELSRVITKSTVILFIALLISGVVLNHINEQRRFTDDNGYILFSPTAYRALKTEIKTIPNVGEYYREQADALWKQFTHSLFDDGDVDNELDEPVKLQFTENYYYEHQLYNYVAREIENVLNYQYYQKNIQDSADNLILVSLFSHADSFYYRNIIKTTEDYAKLHGVTPTIDENAGIVSIMDSPHWDIILLLGLFYLCVKLITDEKKQFVILRTMIKGRNELIRAKIMTVILYCLSMGLVQFAIQIIFAQHYYGLGDLSRPIQSVFITAPYQLNVFEALVFVLLIRLAVYIFLAFVILFICERTKGLAGVFTVTAAVLGISAVMHHTIPAFSAYNIFKYVNPIFFLQSSMFIVQYINLNIFGYPVRFLYVAFSVILILLPLMYWRVLVYPFKLSEYKSIRFPALFWGRTVGLFAHEVWRLFVMNKMILIIIVIALIQFWKLDAFLIKITPAEAAYRLTIEAAIEQDDLYKWALDERERRMNGASDAEKAAIDRVIATLEYLPTSGVLLYDTGYNELFNERSNANDEINSLIAILAIIIVSLYIREWDMERLIKTSLKGRGELYLRKVLLGITVSFIIFLASYLPDFLRIVQTYGLPSLDAQVFSLQRFSENQTLYIWQLVLLTYAIKLFVLITSCLIIVSIPLKNMLYGVLIYVSIFSVPMMLYIIGLRVFCISPFVGMLLSSVLANQYNDMLPLK
ncbi:MAG: hypothetical protein LBC71_03330 [Oscillospiraceae bacterium]|jgi:hypothetical protein|nr:hypothetical protein [Oscillospiraceae bacterium]